MKRIGDIYGKIISIDNIKLAHKKASKGKSHYREVKMVNSNYDHYINEIHNLLKTNSYKTSKYTIEEIFDGRKQRVIHKLPYYPDRIVHHCIMNVLEPYIIKSFIRDTFQSIKGRGTHDAYLRVKRYINKNKPKYALKLDIEKFYPNINNDILFNKLQNKIKCKQTLNILNNIVYSSKGIPIGNYTSQYFGNIYLNDFDWYIKQSCRVKGYFRYCDDMLFFGDSPNELLNLYSIVIKQLNDINLFTKNSYNIYHIPTEGVDFVGYTFYHNHIKLRKSISNKMTTKITRSFTKTDNILSMLMSYKGWVRRCNCKILYRSLLNSFHYKSFTKQLTKQI